MVVPNIVFYLHFINIYLLLTNYQLITNANNKK